VLSWSQDLENWNSLLVDARSGSSGGSEGSADPLARFGE